MRERPMVVTGIMRDLPHNTQLQVDVLIPNTSAADPMSQDDKKGWLWFDGWGYVRLAPGADPAAVVTKLKIIMDHSFDPRKMININLRGSELVTPNLAHFQDDHLSTDQYGGLTPAGLDERLRLCRHRSADPAGSLFPAHLNLPQPAPCCAPARSVCANAWVRRATS